MRNHVNLFNDERCSLDLKGVVRTTMIEIVTQAGDDECEAFDFTKDLPPLSSLRTSERS